MTFKRFLKTNIEETLEYAPIVLINGARQSGKSTLAKELIESGKLSRYITLDDPINLANFLDSSIPFLERLERGTVIDEIQKAAEAFSSIKYVVDENRLPGRFLLTGSANILLLPKLADSLAGRIAIHTHIPHSQREIIGRKEDFVDWLFSDEFDNFKVKPYTDILERVARGSYPEPTNGDYDQKRLDFWYQSYLQTLLLKDVRDVANIEQVGFMPLLLKVLAARTGNILNYADISRTLENLNTKTLTRYIKLLQTLYLVETLPAWYSNYTKKLIKSPKIYLNDTGFAMYLLQKDIEGLEYDRSLYGNLLENFVITEIQKQFGWVKVRPSMYYLRTKDGQEIDLILEAKNDKLVAIEIKASSNFKMNSIDNIKEFQKVMGDKFHRGIIFYTGNQFHRLTDKIYALPIQTLWEERVEI